MSGEDNGCVPSRLVDEASTVGRRTERDNPFFRSLLLLSVVSLRWVSCSVKGPKQYPFDAPCLGCGRLDVVKSLVEEF
jgi:hypothetical protein